MSQFPVITGGILPESGQTGSPYLGNYPTGNPLGGIASGISDLSLGVAAVGHAQQRRDAAAHEAQSQQALTDLEINLYEARSKAKELSVAAPPGDAMRIYDETMQPIRDQIDGIADPLTKSRAKLAFTRSYLAGKEQVADLTARRSASASKASLLRLQETLTSKVEIGDETADSAIAVFNQRTDALIGTALDEDGAETVKLQFAQLITSRQADSLLRAVYDNPDMEPALRAFLDSPRAKQHLDGAARLRILTKLDENVAKGEVLQFQRTIEAHKVGVASAYQSDTNAHNAVADIDRRVAELMAMPGGNATEPEVRKALVLDALEVAAAATPPQREAFDSLAEALKSPTPDGRKYLDGAVAEKVARLRKDFEHKATRHELNVQASERMKKRFVIGLGPGDDIRNADAMAMLADDLLTTRTPAEVAEWVVRDGGTLPKQIVDSLDAAFGKDAAGSDAQIIEAIDTLQTVQNIRPDYATRLLGRLAQGNTAAILMEMGASPENIRVLTSPEGRNGLAAAVQGLTGTGEWNDGEPVTPSDSLGMDDEFPPDAPLTKAWQAAYSLSMAQAASRGADMVSNAETASDNAQKQANAYINSTYTSANGIFFRAATYGLLPASAGMSVDTELFADALAAEEAKVDTGFFQTMRARPDFGMPSAPIGETGADSEVLIPIVDDASLSVVSFVGWNPVTRQVTRSLTQGSAFAAARAAFHRRTPLSAMDKDAVFHRPDGSEVEYVNDQPSIAEKFKRTMQERYVIRADTSLSFDQYLDLQAMSFGWEGFKKPAEDKPAAAKIGGKKE